VAFGKDEPVAIGPMGIFRIVPHHVEKQRDYDVGRRQRSAWMPRTGFGNHLDRRAAHALRDCSQFRGITGFLHGLIQCSIGSHQAGC
jgi:hypothetical protein